ncbi:VIT domain-containing protein [Massilia puerhi]|uniref:VIT domain-containing protein n=1 Tax=Massilia puerhi TaxID=2681550 RepID=UPI00135BABE1|nr:VIT domain-containing protein [Massilia puerhi]
MSDTRHARLESRNGGRAVFDGVQVEGKVHGMLLDVSATQVFRNPGAAHLELVYSFPLPADAVLLSLTVRLGERQLTGSVVEQREASARYEDTLADGDTAIMLERTHDGSYCLNFGNLGPGETGEVCLRYAQALRFEGDGLRLCIPTVIAPRFGNPQRDGGLDPHQVPAHDMFATYPFALALQLASGFATATIGSPSHKIAVRNTPAGARVMLGQNAALDRDFVLTLEGLEHASQAIAAPDATVAGQTMVLAGFRPRCAEPACRPISTKILVDCSGSMAGDSIAAARKALQAVIRGLREGDRFSLSRFGDSVQHRGRRLWKATDATRLGAARWIGELDADLGGTEMAAALASTFALDDAAPCDLLLVTDGHIHAIDDVIDAARSARHRLFIVAIGSAVSESHLRRLAQATQGAVDFVAPGQAVEGAIERMFARLRSPRLGELRLAWASGRSVQWASLPDSVFNDDSVHVYACVDGDAAGDELRLFGRDGDGGEHAIGVATIAPVVDDGALARMAIHARLQGDAQLPQAQRTRLACDYGLVTPQTSFLLTLERAAGDKAHAMPELQQVAQMLPAGWGGVGSVHGAGQFPRQPAVWRRESTFTEMRAASQVELYDIPAFLRRQQEDVGASVAGDRSAQSRWQRVAAWWRSAPHGQRHDRRGHVTPLALHGMLSSTPSALWDASFADLLASDIDPAVVVWLRETFGDSHPEAEVVASFLACMAEADMGRTLQRTAGLSWLATVRLASRRRHLPPVALPAAANALLAARMAAALAGIDAQAWPPAILCFDETRAAPAVA